MAASGSDLGCSIVGNLCCLSRSLLVVDQVFFTWHPRRATASAQLLSLLAFVLPRSFRSCDNYSRPVSDSSRL